MTTILGLDSATEACSVALWQDGELTSRFENVGRHHSEKLLPMVQSVLDEAGCRLADIDAFACGVGPGSFVGVRVGVGVVKGMALALDRPCIAVSSLELLARGVAFNAGDTVAVAIDARMSELYFAAYRRTSDGRLDCFEVPRVCSPDALPRSLAEAIAVGTGWAAYPQALECGAVRRAELGTGTDLPDIAVGMADAAAQVLSGKGLISAAELEPIYLRNQIALTLEEQRKARS